MKCWPCIVEAISQDKRMDDASQQQNRGNHHELDAVFCNQFVGQNPGL